MNTDFLKKRTSQIVLASVAGVLLLSGSVYAGFAWGNNSENATTANYTYGRGSQGGGYGNGGNSNQMQQHEQMVVAQSTALTNEQTDKLLYLIEEEKLAHDVYVKMYEKYGAKVFNNISRSETRHGDSLLALLEARNIDDPRSSEVGVFKNDDLQKLYDTLIAQGNKSVTDAYKVGKLIEETDIADIDKDLQVFGSDNSDVVTVLNNLRNGSENHLRAFTRQLG